MREELWWKLRSSTVLRKLSTLPVLGTVMRKASLMLLPTLTEKVLQVKDGPGKGFYFELNPRWENGLWRGSYEPDAERIMEKYFKPGKTFYDVGGGIGFYTLVAARRGAKVFTIEPDPKNFELIQRHAKLNNLQDKLNLVPLAVYSHTGSLLMEPSDKGEGHGHGHVQEVFGTAPSKCIEVECTTLDDFARKNPAPDLVKIDVEGCEADVFQGSEWLMRETRTAILCEVHNAELAARIEKIVLGRNYNLEWLDDSDYTVRWLYATPQ
jgi:FkbM family methyltransferase